MPAAVSKAFTCLSDPAKRRNYDTYGREDGAAANLGGGMGRRGGGGGGGGGGFYGGMEVDPEELFNMWVLAKQLMVLHCCYCRIAAANCWLLFNMWVLVELQSNWQCCGSGRAAFAAAQPLHAHAACSSHLCRFFGGNPFMGGNVYRGSFGGGGGNPFQRQHAAQQQQRQRQQQQQGGGGGGGGSAASNPMVQLMQMLPLLMLLLFTFLSSRSSPPYSLQRSREYQYEQATATYEVPFWAKDPQQLQKAYPPGSRER